MPDKHSHMNHKVDPELIRRYLAGELDDRAMHALERQAMDDPFLAEAMEGFAAYKPDQRVHLGELAKRLEMRVQGKEEKSAAIFPLNYKWMAAAAVLLFAGIGALWMWRGGDKKSSTIALNKVNISDSSITDTLQYYNQEVPMAWGNDATGRPIRIPAPVDSNLLAIREHPITMTPGAEQAAPSLMLSKDMDSERISMTPAVVADSLDMVVTALGIKREQKPLAYTPNVTTRVIQGRVRAANDAEGVAGVAVSVEGTNHGALTDNQGKFSITVADTTKDVRLVVAALGFDAKKMEVDEKENNVDITLRQARNAQEEVATSAYSYKSGKYRKQDVYQPPMPAEGYERFKEYLAKNVQYPASAAAGNVKGRVKVSFRVMPDGTREDYKITRRLQPDCDAEALRVVKEAPNWLPASDGRATRVTVEVPFAP